MFDRVAILLAASLALSACGGRWDEDWKFLNPSCAPDGSVVFYEMPNKEGEYAGLKNSPANCTWNKKT